MVLILTLIGVTSVLTVGITFIVQDRRKSAIRIQKLEKQNDNILNMYLHQLSFVNDFVVGKELPNCYGVVLKGTSKEDLVFFRNQLDLAKRINSVKEEK